MQRQGAKNHHEKGRTPAETKVREASGRKSPQKRPIWRRLGKVWFAETGWVEAVGHKLATHHPVIEPVSAAEPGTEICDAETGSQKATYHLAETNPETRRSAKSPHSGAINAKGLAEIWTLPLGGGRTRARTWDPMIKN
jgi:hypothetical protein